MHRTQVMNIDIIKENLDNYDNSKIKSIILLIINAVNDYPIYNLRDVDKYFQYLEKHLSLSEINQKHIEDKVYNGLGSLHPDIDDHSIYIWIEESINSMKEAFSLMELYKVDFGDVLIEMRKLSVS